MNSITHKKSFLTLIMFMVMALMPTLTFANGTTNPNPEVPAKVQVMLDRLEEIKEMDKSELSRAEKKLQKEVRVIKKELRSTGNGVYLSVGAIIIIVLLLILLL